MAGWIKLHRSISDHWIMENPDYFRAWVILLMEVNHAPKKVLLGNNLYEVQRGMSIKSVDTWAETFNHGLKRNQTRWTRQRVRTFFRLLQNDCMIELKTNQQTTRLTVVNYCTYQDRNQQSNQQPTNGQPTANQQPTTNKNGKNEKNDGEGGEYPAATAAADMKKRFRRAGAVINDETESEFESLVGFYKNGVEGLLSEIRYIHKKTAKPVYPSDIRRAIQEG